MDKPKPANKQIEDLAFKDFAAYPIWGFADDDGDEVMPVDYPGYLKAPDGGEGWFVACEFALRDGSRLPGVIYVRTTDRSIYMLVFSRPDGEFFHFPVNSRMEGRVTPEQLAAQLHKSVEDLFPITYTTPFVFKDGQKLFGQYDFPARHK